MDTHRSSPADSRQEASLVLITGMSGAGRKESATVLEEMGWYVADNLPPELIMRMVELSFESDSPVEKLAIVTDVRSRDFVGSLTEVLAGLHDSGRRPVVLFLDADDATLVRRYGKVRRTHPLQGGDTLQAGIDRERDMLRGIRQRADIVIDTTGTSVHDLRRELEDYFTALSDRREHVTVQSFGFKNGAPRDVDLMFDARFLPNPYWEPELREYSGLDAPVADYVLDRPEAEAYLDAVQHVLETALPGYRREGKHFITVGVGCTGGQHRSPAVTEALARRLAELPDLDVRTVHRDIVRHADRVTGADDILGGEAR